jgi:acetylcholinesterase
VWFYIQGGGYATNSNANYNGTEVVEHSGHDIVLVNFNYRVGALGFLASEEVRSDGDLNAGLLDQRQALYWVQQNIEKVGQYQSLSSLRCLTAPTTTPYMPASAKEKIA